MKDLVPLSIDPDRLTFVAGPPSFDERIDLEDDFAGLIGIGIEDAFDTPEHHHEVTPRKAATPPKTPHKLHIVK